MPAAVPFHLSSAMCRTRGDPLSSRCEQSEHALPTKAVERRHLFFDLQASEHRRSALLPNRLYSFRTPPAAEVEPQDRDGRWRHAGDAACLA